MTSVNPQCHAELVSAPHMLSVLHAGHLSCGILKQVQDDFRFSTFSGKKWVSINYPPENPTPATGTTNLINGIL